MARERTDAQKLEAWLRTEVPATRLRGDVKKKSFPRGHGRGTGSLQVVVSKGTPHFYYKYVTASGKRDEMPLGSFAKREGAAAAIDASDLAMKDHEFAVANGFDGVRAYREHIANAKAEERAEIERKKRFEQKEEELRNKYTLKSLLETYVEIKTEEGREGSARDAMCLFRNYVFGHPVAMRPANQVTRKETAAIIRAVRESGKKRAWTKLRSYLLAAYNAAEGAEDDSAADSRYIPFEINEIPISKPKEPGKLKSDVRDRFLDREELRFLMEKLEERGGYKADFLRLVLLTGQRMEQLLRAEIKDFNITDRTLTILDGKGRRATPKKHKIPLEKEAFGIVMQFREAAVRGESSFIFSHSPHNHFSQDLFGRLCTSISAELLEGKKIRAPFRAGDIRTTVATHMSRLGVSSDVKKRALSHGVYGVHETHYDMHDYEKEIRGAFRRWEAELKRIREDDLEKRVVQIRA